MANKPFSIQESKLRIAGVDLEAGNTTIVIPGVTQATNYRVEEVENTGDQTYQFAPNSGPVVIDAALYATIIAQGNESGWADFTVTTDDDGYIDEIQVNGQGTYSQSNAGIASSNDMYAYVGAGSASDRPLVPQDWIQIPFRPKMRAGDIENIGGGGGGGSSITNGGESFTIDGDGDVVFDGNGNGGVNRGLVWQYGDNVGGLNSQIRQDQSGLTVRAWTENGEGTYAAPVNIVTNQDANQKTWTFDGAGNLTFPDGTIQTTAYTTSTLKTFYLNDYGGIDPIEEPVEIVIDGMSYEGGVVTTDGAFGPGSSRVTLYADSMFAMVAVNSTATDVYYNGEMGADGDGTKVKTDLLLDNYRGYYASSCLFSGSDPAISQIVISKGNSQVTEFHQNPEDTNVDDFHVSGVGSGTVVVLNVYWDSQNAPYNGSIQLAAQSFIDTVIFDGGDERTNIALMASAFYTGSAAIKSTIENYEGDLLYSNFDFYEGEQVVHPTGGTGTGFVALVSAISGGNYSDEFVIKPGTGYTQNDTLTVAGSEFGGTSPANDVTITINGVDGTGSVTSWSVNGTVPSQVWPGSFIIDGDSDQYDTGNFIGTNFTRVTAIVTVETVTLESNDLTKMTVVSADKDISLGQFAFFNGQNRGDYIVYADSYGINNTAEYFDSNTGYISTQSLTYDFAVDVDNAHVTLNGAGNWSIGSNNLNTKIFNTDEIDPEDRDIVIMAGSQNNNWLFRRDGVLELPSGGDILMDGQSVLGGVSAQLVGDGYSAGTGYKRTVYTNFDGYQGGESTSVLFNKSDLLGETFAIGDTITFRNGEVRTITSYDDTYNENTQVAVGWDTNVEGGDLNPRYPITLTTSNYVAETKLTARIKPDSMLVGSGQYMEVYAGGPTVLEQKHIHMAGANADTELFLGTDNNFVSAKEAGLSPARVNLKSENDITVTDTNLRMTRGSTWVNVYGDGQNRDWRNNVGDLTWNVVESDDQGNFYVGGENQSWADAMVAKYGPDGDLIWKKIVNGDNISGWQLDGIAYNPVDKEIGVAVQTNYQRSHDYYKLTVLDSETGDVKSSLDIYDPDGNIDIYNMAWNPTLGYVAVGRTYGEMLSSNPIAGIAGTGTSIIELPVQSVKVGGAWPDINSGTWTISGTNITGSQQFQWGGPGLYQEVPITNLTNPSATGLTVGFRINYSGGYYEQLLPGTSGTGTWNFDDDYKVPGSYFYNGIDGGTNISAAPSAMSQAGSDALAFFDTTTYPDLYNQLNACTWTVTLNTVTYNVIGCASTNNGALWAVTLQNCTDLNAAPMLFYTEHGNDIYGKVADANGIQNPINGTPNTTTGVYRIDMGYMMGYNGTDFTGGTFTISSIVDGRAFVWTDAWSKFYNPSNGSSTSIAYSVATSKITNDIVVGGYDNGASKGFVWKLDNTGTTQWIYGPDGDGVYSVAVSEVTGEIYFTTNYDSLNKTTANGTLLKRIEPNGPWGQDSPIVKLRQELDGTEYLYVGGTFGAMWSGQTGYMISKFNSNLDTIWSRDIWNNDRSLNSHYDVFHNNFALGRDNAVLVGYSYLGSPDYYNGYLASMSILDDFTSLENVNNWNLENTGSYVNYTDQTANYTLYNFLNNGGTVATSSMTTEGGNDSNTWLNWTWQSLTVRLETTDNGIVGVESIQFADGGKLDHNPSDIPPVFTDFSQVGWNYTLKLSDRGKFITNGQGIENYTNDLFITVPKNSDLSFPVGSVITLINLSDTGTNNNYIYVQPDNFGNDDCPRIYATGFGTTWSTWSFPGIQTATLMKIGSNEWLLTANNIQNED